MGKYAYVKLNIILYYFTRKRACQYVMRKYFLKIVRRGCLKCNKKHLRQFFFCVTEKDFAEVKKKASKRGENEYDKKRIVEILVF